MQSDINAEEREVAQLDLENWCNENGIASCIETSAKSASNVQEAFKMAVQHWLRAESKADKNECAYSDTVDLNKKQSDYRSSCCAGATDE